MKKKLDELSLNNLAGKQIASLTTQRFSGERREIMGDAPKSTKLINSKVNYNEDTVTYFFLTEATEKYPPNYMYQDIVPQNNFSFEPDPSKTYEIVLKFGYISRLKDNPNLTINDVKAFLWNTDVKIWSNSPSFHWQGFNYNLSQLDAALYPTNIAPQKWDKIHGEALIDKHLLAADVAGSNKDFSEIELLERKIQEFNAEPKLPDPIIKGRDLIDLGLKPGPLFKEILQKIMDAQLEGVVTNFDEGIFLVKEMMHI